jgi:hypothetical protein
MLEDANEAIVDLKAKRKAKEEEIAGPTCAWCLKVHKFKKMLLAQQEEAGIEVVKEISSVTKPNQSWAGCDHCNVPLCKSSNCWTN